MYCVLHRVGVDGSTNRQPSTRYNTNSYKMGTVVGFKYRPLHKTLPRSSAFLNCILVRFYETGCKEKLYLSRITVIIIKMIFIYWGYTSYKSYTTITSLHLEEMKIVFYTLCGHLIVTAREGLKSITTQQPGNKPTLCP